jgi:C4-dicarboxylate-specific signal transduction histidine kinase
MLVDFLSENEIHELQSRLHLQQEMIEKQNRDILNLKTTLAEATQKNSEEHCTNCRMEDESHHKKQADITLNQGVVPIAKMVSVFVHEINQPLTAISAYSQCCLHIIKNKLKHEKISDELVRILERITEQTAHAGNILRDMQGIKHDDHSYL